MIYYGSLVLMVFLAFTLYKNNSPKLALLALLGAAYIIYSDATGYTATDFKNEMIESIDESAQDFVKTNKTETVE